jgi:hypothetical protein
VAGVTDLYAHYRAKLRALVASAMPEGAFETAVLEFVRELEDDLVHLGPAEQEVLCDNLGVQLENDLYCASDGRQRRVLVRLLKVVDSR